MRIASRVVTPYWAAAGSQSWNAVSSCKMFMPCDGVAGGAFTEKVSGASIQSTEAYTLAYDSDLLAVYSDAPIDAVYSFAASQSFEPIVSGKTSLLMYAGYLSFADGDANTTNGGRFAVGAGSSTGCGVYSLAPAHAVVSNATEDYLVTSTYNAGAYGGNTETAQIESVVGVGGYFYKIGVWLPTGVLSVTIRDGATGNEIAAYVDSDATAYAGDFCFNRSLRFGGIKMTGAARFDFDALPAAYLSYAFWQAAEWKRGNKVILANWD